ncbi:GTPase and tRNA-U34 5-formylation enzyme trmE [Vibrio sp. JCM 19236]|nr:GTPase and tRNA-U34 5-formylation enzyme trmE [Vibrio sp. JCM 19236]
MTNDTIVAQATAPGRGGVGIIRVSGPQAVEVAKHLVGKTLAPRRAEYLPFLAADGVQIDQALPSISQIQTPLPVKTFLNYKAMASCSYGYAYQAYSGDT